jgi:hypothetical protein
LRLGAAETQPIGALQRTQSGHIYDLLLQLAKQLNRAGIAARK